jgi:CMP/dCMP kinase
MTEPLVITIDGPAGAGKSTVAKMLAARLGLSYVDSGATYRAAALKVLESNVSPDDEAKVVETVARAEIAFDVTGVKPTVLLDGRDVTDKIHLRGDACRGQSLAAAGSAEETHRDTTCSRARKGCGDGRPRHWNGGLSVSAAEDFS